MCLPGNTIAGRVAKFGVAAQVRDRIFGKGTSAKLVGHVDKGFKKTVAGRLKKKAGIGGDEFGLPPSDGFGLG